MTYGMPKKRGPFGTNEGDMWTIPGSPLQERFDKEGTGTVVIVEMMVKDGVLQECIYHTDVPELIEKATRGHELLIQARAQRN